MRRALMSAALLCCQGRWRRRSWLLCQPTTLRSPHESDFDQALALALSSHCRSELSDLPCVEFPDDCEGDDCADEGDDLADDGDDEGDSSAHEGDDFDEEGDEYDASASALSSSAMDESSGADARGFFKASSLFPTNSRVTSTSCSATLLLTSSDPRFARVFRARWLARHWSCVLPEAATERRCRRRNTFLRTAQLCLENRCFSEVAERSRLPPHSFPTPSYLRSHPPTLVSCRRSFVVRHRALFAAMRVRAHLFPLSAMPVPCKIGLVLPEAATERRCRRRNTFLRTAQLCLEKTNFENRVVTRRIGRSRLFICTAMPYEEVVKFLYIRNKKFAP